MSTGEKGNSECTSSVQKLKDKVREITGRSSGWNIEYRRTLLNQVIRGWVNYFKLANMEKLMQQLDEWTRSRIRMVTWKRWKRVRTRFTNLKTLGVDVGEYEKGLLANCP